MAEVTIKEQKLLLDELIKLERESVYSAGRSQTLTPITSPTMSRKEEKAEKLKKSRSRKSSFKNVLKRDKTDPNLKVKQKEKENNQVNLADSVQKIWQDYENEIKNRRAFIDKIKVLSTDYNTLTQNLRSDKDVEKIKKHKLHHFLNNSISLKNSENQIIYEFRRNTKRMKIYKNFSEKYLTKVEKKVSDDETKYLTNIVDILASFELAKKSIDISKHAEQILFADNVLMRINELDYKSVLSNLKYFKKNGDVLKELKKDISNTKSLCKKYKNWFWWSLKFLIKRQ